MTALVLTLLLGGDAGVAPDDLGEIQRVARIAQGHARATWVRDFLGAAQSLERHPPRVFYRSADKQVAFSEAEALALSDAQRATLKRIDADDGYYYARIADPLGYWRSLEVLAERAFHPRGKRILDFGYGSIGQLKMLAALGADAWGIEVDPVLPLLYASEVDPRVHTLHGYFPSDPKLSTQVGTGYDLWMAKNTLKRGYVAPPAGIHPVIDLGGDALFLANVRRMLKPGGLFYLYNFGPAPAPAGKPYLPMSDIGCPFPRAALEAAGFEVLAYDVDDTSEGRRAAHIMEWDRGPGAIDLEHDLFSRFTLARRPSPIDGR